MITNKLRNVLANELVFSIQMQSFHWNVRGMLFSQLHDFFGDLYEGSYGTVDRFAEYIRILGEMAPCCIADIYKDKSIPEITYVPGTPQEMLQVAMTLNGEVLASVNELIAELDPKEHAGLLDYASTVNDMHNKWKWMIKAHMDI